VTSIHFHQRVHAPWLFDLNTQITPQRASSSMPQPRNTTRKPPFVSSESRTISHPPFIFRSTRSHTSDKGDREYFLISPVVVSSLPECTRSSTS
jgi:hypothetical protein